MGNHHPSSQMSNPESVHVYDCDISETEHGSSLRGSLGSAALCGDPGHIYIYMYMFMIVIFQKQNHGSPLRGGLRSAALCGDPGHIYIYMYMFMIVIFQKQNTGLHYAAASGLRRCVELLVNANGPLFLENALKQTPCDCSEKNDHSDIALYLESKMVFSVRLKYCIRPRKKYCLFPVTV